LETTRKRRKKPGCPKGEVTAVIFSTYANRPNTTGRNKDQRGERVWENRSQRVLKRINLVGCPGKKINREQQEKKTSGGESTEGEL